MNPVPTNCSVDEINTLLKDLSSEKERLEALWKHFQSKMTEFGPLPIDRKNEFEAYRLKDEGNKNYTKRHFRYALECYNQALCYAREGSDVIPLILANRSAVYLATKKYRYCIENVDMALQLEYPVQHRHKLEERREKCLALMAKGSEKIDPAPAMKAAIASPNPKYPFISKDINLEIDKNGLRLVATKDLKLCDVFFREEVFLSFMEPETPDLYGRCFACYRANFFSLMACPNCTIALYCKNCSEKKEVRELHRLECPILKYLFENDCGGLGYPLYAHCLARILTLFPDLNKLKSEIKAVKKSPKHLLEGDWVNNQNQQIVKLIFLRWNNAEISLNDWTCKGFIAGWTLLMALQSPPIKSRLPTESDQFMALEILFNLTLHKPFRVRDCVRYGKCITPLRHIIRAVDLEFNAEIIEALQGDPVQYAYILRPVKKGDSIRIADDLFVRQKTEEQYQSTNQAMAIVNAKMTGDAKQLIQYYLPTFPPEFRKPTGLKIYRFDPEQEFMEHLLSDEDNRAIFKQKMNKFSRVVEQNDRYFPCYEIGLAIWCLMSTVKRAYADAEYNFQASMWPNHDEGEYFSKFIADLQNNYPKMLS